MGNLETIERHRLSEQPLDSDTLANPVGDTSTSQTAAAAEKASERTEGEQRRGDVKNASATIPSSSLSKPPVKRDTVLTYITRAIDTELEKNFDPTSAAPIEAKSSVEWQSSASKTTTTTTNDTGGDGKPALSALLSYRIHGSGGTGQTDSVAAGPAAAMASASRMEPTPIQQLPVKRPRVSSPDGGVKKSPVAGNDVRNGSYPVRVTGKLQQNGLTGDQLLRLNPPRYQHRGEWNRRLNVNQVKDSATQEFNHATSMQYISPAVAAVNESRKRTFADMSPRHGLLPSNNYVPDGPRVTGGNVAYYSEPDRREQEMTSSSAALMNRMSYSNYPNGMAAMNVAAGGKDEYSQGRPRSGGMHRAGLEPVSAVGHAGAADVVRGNRMSRGPAGISRSPSSMAGPVGRMADGPSSQSGVPLVNLASYLDNLVDSEIVGGVNRPVGDISHALQSPAAMPSSRQVTPTTSYAMTSDRQHFHSGHSVYPQQQQQQQLLQQQQLQLQLQQQQQQGHRLHYQHSPNAIQQQLQQQPSPQFPSAAAVGYNAPQLPPPSHRVDYHAGSQQPQPISLTTRRQLLPSPPPLISNAPFPAGTGGGRGARNDKPAYAADVPGRNYADDTGVPIPMTSSASIYRFAPPPPPPPSTSQQPHGHSGSSQYFPGSMTMVMPPREALQRPLPGDHRTTANYISPPYVSRVEKDNRQGEQKMNLSATPAAQKSWSNCTNDPSGDVVKMTTQQSQQTLPDITAPKSAFKIPPAYHKRVLITGCGSRQEQAFWCDVAPSPRPYHEAAEVAILTAPTAAAVAPPTRSSEKVALQQHKVAYSPDPSQSSISPKGVSRKLPAFPAVTGVNGDLYQTDPRANSVFKRDLAGRAGVDIAPPKRNGQLRVQHSSTTGAHLEVSALKSAVSANARENVFQQYVLRDDCPFPASSLEHRSSRLPALPAPPVAVNELAREDPSLIEDPLRLPVAGKFDLIIYDERRPADIRILPNCRSRQYAWSAEDCVPLDLTTEGCFLAELAQKPPSPPMPSFPSPVRCFPTTSYDISNRGHSSKALEETGLLDVSFRTDHYQNKTQTMYLPCKIVS